MALISVQRSDRSETFHQYSMHLPHRCIAAGIPPLNKSLHPLLRLGGGANLLLITHAFAPPPIYALHLGGGANLLLITHVLAPPPIYTFILGGGTNLLLITHAFATPPI